MFMNQEQFHQIAENLEKKKSLTVSFIIEA